MSFVDLVVDTTISRSARARQVEALFDVPSSERSKLTWQGEVPLDAQPWSVGLIVGPSGCGKTSVARQLFKEDFHPEMKWAKPSVIDDVSEDIDIKQVTEAFSSVGFSTIPAWLRPYSVLSNGERFRVDLARRLLELKNLVVVDEFTSVVDRQVAKIGAHAVQKFVRKSSKKFVAVSCHYDVLEWLQPDWVLEPSTMNFQWRSVRQRPEIEITISRVDYSTWRLFAPFHYLDKTLNKAATCFCAFVNGEPVAFAGVLHFPHPKVKNIKRLSRIVTLPDWQGLGLAFVLTDAIAAAFSTHDFRFRTYPAHPSLVRSFSKSAKYAQLREGGDFRNSGAAGRTTTTTKLNSAWGGRPCAVFEYVGERMNEADAKALLA